MDLVCVQETKIQDLSNVCTRSFRAGRFHDWKALEAERAVGGILLFWEKQKMDLVEAEIGSFSIMCLFKMWKMGLCGLSQEFTTRLKGANRRSFRKS